MDFFFLQTALEVIDLRSFSNLWFWIALAVMWSSACHWVIGVPFDMVRRASKGHETSLQDMHALANIQARRLLYIGDATGTVSTVFTFFSVTVLVLLGFLYDIEFAQAILFLFLPMMIVASLSFRTARKVEGLDAYDLGNLLAKHRRSVQMVGVVSIFATSMWGMWVNLNQSVLGG
ncbi:MAG: component of SufBCD complex [Pseudomonadota bacterium]